MLVVEINHVNVEPAQRVVTRLHHVLRVTVDTEVRTVVTALVAELRGEHYFASPILDCLADEHFILEGAVHVGGVEKGHTTVERLVNCGCRLGVVALSVELAHAHASQALCRDFQTLTQYSTLHADSPFVKLLTNLCLLAY